MLDPCKLEVFFNDKSKIQEQKQGNAVISSSGSISFLKRAG